MQRLQTYTVISACQETPSWIQEVVAWKHIFTRHASTISVWVFCNTARISGAGKKYILFSTVLWRNQPIWKGCRNTWTSCWPKSNALSNIYTIKSHFYYMDNFSKMKQYQNVQCIWPPTGTSANVFLDCVGINGINQFCLVNFMIAV